MTRPFRPLFASLPVLLALGACGVISDNLDYNQQAIEGALLLNQFQGLPLTPPSSMPSSGTATYSGIAGFTYDDVLAVDEQYDLLADVQMTADFDTDAISGQMANLNSPDGNVSGPLSVANGAIAGNTFTADLSGTIILPNSAGTQDLDLNIVGLFRSAAGGAIAGTGVGTYTNDDATGGDIYVNFGAD